MTATIGVTFGAGSAAKRIILFAINVTVLVLGLSCSVLCLYQVKLMPETFEDVVKAMQESNFTIPAPIFTTLLPVAPIPRNSSNNGRSTLQPGGSKKGSPRVSRYVRPKNDSSFIKETTLFPTTLVKNTNSSAETRTANSSSFGMQMSITNPVPLSKTTTSTVTKSTAISNGVSTQGVTLNQPMNSTDQVDEFLRQLSMDTNSEGGIKAKLGSEGNKTTTQEIGGTTTQSLVIQLPFGEFDASKLVSDSAPLAQSSTSSSTIRSSEQSTSTISTTKLSPSTTVSPVSITLSSTSVTAKTSLAYSPFPSPSTITSMQPLVFNSSAIFAALVVAPESTTQVSTTPASTTPASTTPASTTPASTTPASTSPTSTTPALTTPALTTPTLTTPAPTMIVNNQEKTTSTTTIPLVTTAAIEKSAVTTSLSPTSPGTTVTIKNSPTVSISSSSAITSVPPLVFNSSAIFSALMVAPASTTPVPTTSAPTTPRTTTPTTSTPTTTTLAPTTLAPTTPAPTILTTTTPTTTTPTLTILVATNASTVTVTTLEKTTLTATIPLFTTAAVENSPVTTWTATSPAPTAASTATATVAVTPSLTVSTPITSPEKISTEATLAETISTTDLTVTDTLANPTAIATSTTASTMASNTPRDTTTNQVTTRSPPLFTASETLPPARTTTYSTTNRITVSETSASAPTATPSTVLTMAETNITSPTTVLISSTTSSTSSAVPTSLLPQILTVPVSSVPLTMASPLVLTSVLPQPTTVSVSAAQMMTSPTKQSNQQSVTSTEAPTIFTTTATTTSTQSTTRMSTTTTLPATTTTWTTSTTTTTSRPITTTLLATPAPTTKIPSTISAPGFIDLSSIFKNIGRRDLFRHRLQKRASAPVTVSPPTQDGDLTVDHIPGYFEQLFFFVQTSLYVCTAAGLLIFFSSLAGICGGLFRLDGCLKFSVAALVLVIMAELATTAFIFVAHDKASNRNKNKNFDRDLKLLCDAANFCIQPMMLVIVGSFLCVSLVLQIGSITLACNLMDSRNESDPDKKFRKMMRSSRADFQFGAGSMYPYSNPMPMQMPMHCCSGYGGMGGNAFPYPSPMMMPMQNMGYCPPLFAGPGQRPMVNIIA